MDVFHRREVTLDPTSYAGQVAALHREMLDVAAAEARRRGVGIRVTEVGEHDLDIHLDPAVPVDTIHYRRDWTGRLAHHLPAPVGQEQESTPPDERGSRLRGWRLPPLVPVFTAVVTIRLAPGLA